MKVMIMIYGGVKKNKILRCNRKVNFTDIIRIDAERENAKISIITRSCGIISFDVKKKRVDAMSQDLIVIMQMISDYYSQGIRKTAEIRIHIDDGYAEMNISREKGYRPKEKRGFINFIKRVIFRR